MDCNLRNIPVKILLVKIVSKTREQGYLNEEPNVGTEDEAQLRRRSLT